MRYVGTLVLALGLGFPQWSAAQEAGAETTGAETAGNSAGATNEADREATTDSSTDVPQFSKPVTSGTAESAVAAPADAEAVSEPTIDERLSRLEEIVNTLVRELTAAKAAGGLSGEASARLDKVEDEVELINGVLEGMASDLRNLRSNASGNLAARAPSVAPPDPTPGAGSGSAREARRPTEGTLIVHNRTGAAQEYVINGVQQLLPTGDSSHLVPFGEVTVHFPSEVPVLLGNVDGTRMRWRDQAGEPVLEVTLR